MTIHKSWARFLEPGPQVFLMARPVQSPDGQLDLWPRMEVPVLLLGSHGAEYWHKVLELQTDSKVKAACLGIARAASFLHHQNPLYAQGIMGIHLIGKWSEEELHTITRAATFTGSPLAQWLKFKKQGVYFDTGAADYGQEHLALYTLLKNGAREQV